MCPAMETSQVATEARSAVQPRGLGEILSEAFALYRSNAALLIGTTALAMGPLDLLKDVLLASADGGVATAVALLVALLAFVVSIPFVVLGAFAAQAALTVLVADRARGGALRWQDPWRIVWANLGPLLLTSFLVFAGVAVGSLFCLLPGMVFGLFAAFSVPVVLLERKSGVAAIARSFELVRADWVRTALVLFVFGVLKLAAAVVGGALVPAQFALLHLLVRDLLALAAVPIPILGLVLLYQDRVGTPAAGS